jgi:hypothetical protein
MKASSSIRQADMNLLTAWWKSILQDTQGLLGVALRSRMNSQGLCKLGFVAIRMWGASWLLQEAMMDLFEQTHRLAGNYNLLLKDKQELTWSVR